MANVLEFYNDPDWEQSSMPHTYIQVHEADLWPLGARCVAGAGKDVLEDGQHPVFAIGGRTAADGRPLNLTGVVVGYTPGLTVGTGIAVLDIASGVIVRQYVRNILAYAATYETTPVPGQAVYVDDSAALSAGVTLGLSPLNSAGTKNPLAGYLMYCQKEYANVSIGGANATATFDGTLANSPVEQVYCVLLVNAARDF